MFKGKHVLPCVLLGARLSVRNSMQKNSKGFTLIELMVTVVIVSILAAVALPAYQQYVTKSKRNQAKAVILGISQSEERYYTNNYVF